MKRIITVFTVLCLCVLMMGTTSFAAAERIDLSHVYVELTAPDGFETVTPDNLAEHQKLLDYIGTTQEKMANYMTSNFIEMFSMPLDKSCELTLQVYEIKEFDVFDLANADEEMLTSIRENIENNEGYTCNSIELIEKDGSKFFKVDRTDVAAINAISYVTVKNGANYALTLTKSNGEELTQIDRDYADFAFQSLTFTETLKDPNQYGWLVYLLVGVLVVVGVAIAYVVLKRTSGWGDKSGQLKMKKR